MSCNADRELAVRTRKRVTRRLVPYLMFIYMLAYLDRANVGVAKLRMQADMGFNDSVIGFGAGNLLPWVSPARHSGEPDCGALERAEMDCANHDFLGRGRCSDGVPGHSTVRFRATYDTVLWLAALAGHC